MTTRRRLLQVGIVAGIAAPALRARAQSARIPRVGFVLTVAPLSTMAGLEPEQIVMRGFVHGLRALGYVDGRNVLIERRSAEGKLENLEGLIRGLVQAPVDVIVVTGNPMTQLAKKISTTIPIVVAGMGDPVESGFVQSLARPGGNITGLSPNIRLAKRLQLVHEMLPNATRVAYLGLKESFNTAELDELRAAAASMKLTLNLVEAQFPRIEAALDLIAQQRPDALLVSSDAPFFVSGKLIADYAAKIRVPDFHYFYQAVENGALASYGHSAYALFHRAASYVDRILKGAHPRDLPVEQVERYSFVLNLKTARTLGITIPQSVLVRAEQVIE